MHILLKSTNKQQYGFDVEESLSVGELKELVHIENETIDPSRLKLVYKGNVMKNEELLGRYNMTEGAVVYMINARPVRRPVQEEPAPAQAPQPVEEPAPAAQEQPAQSSGPRVDPFGNLGNMNFFNMMEQFMRPPASNAVPNEDTDPGLGSMRPPQPSTEQPPVNPFAGMMGMPSMGEMNMENMQEMMNNPMIRDMMRNMSGSPDFSSMISQMGRNHPQMRQMLEDHPEMAQVMESDEFKETIERVLNDPDELQNLMRDADNALNNINSHPDGERLLNRVYTEMQPLQDSMTPSERIVRPNDAEANEEVEARPFGEEEQPRTNPFAAPPANPFAAPSANPFAAMSGMGGMGGMPQMTPEMIQMSMRMLSENPQMLETVMNMNPQLRQMVDSDPMLGMMLRNPSMMEGVMSMMGGGAPPAASSNTSSEPTTQPPRVNPFAMFQQANRPAQPPREPAVQPAVQPAEPVQPPRERFSGQLTQLRDMGYFDDEENLRLLQLYHGNMARVIGHLCGDF
ncbi:hypothetical protein PCE1_002925 [Barthelona sp. PCE]